MTPDNLTPPELAAMRIIAEGDGTTTWYQVERRVLPYDHPGHDANSVHLLATLRALGYAEVAAEVDSMRRHGITAAGCDRLRRASPA